MRIYLADLAHDYMPARRFAPLGVSTAGAFARRRWGRTCAVQSAERLLDAVES